MKPSQTQVFLFDGERKAVQDRVNEFLRMLGREPALEPEIVGFAYNFQGDEWDGHSRIDGSASHGIMLIAHYPTINEARERRGFDPIAAQPGAAPAGGEESAMMVPLEDFLRSFASQAPQHQKKSLLARIGEILFRR